MLLVDAHCHIADFEEIDKVIEEAREHHVGKIVGVGDDPESNLRLLRIAEEYPGVVYPSVGFHPWEAAEASAEQIEEFKRQVERYAEVIVCIGEVGVDRRFVRGEERLRRQIEVFELAARLAAEYDLPLNIHSVRAEKLILQILEKYEVTRALFHWYSGSYESLEKLLSRGYYVSVNLALRYSKRARGVAERAPLGLILLESDSPYEFAGEHATPASVLKVAAELASIKKVSLEQVADITSRSAHLLFSL